MKSKVNILCLYWVGDFRGRDFKAEDVYRLHQSVSKHIDRPFDFYVLTNDMNASLPGIKIELKHGEDWEGWWAKMELYRPDILPKRRTLYLDLDSHVIRNLEPILNYEGDLVLFDDMVHQHSLKHEQRNEMGWVYRYQASTILYDPWKWGWLYKKFLKDWNYYITHYRSDQDVLGEWIPDQPTFPPVWLMKMATLERHVPYRKKMPKDTRLVTGQPKSGLFRQTHRIEWFEKEARG